MLGKLGFCTKKKNTFENIFDEAYCILLSYNLFTLKVYKIFFKILLGMVLPAPGLTLTKAINSAWPNQFKRPAEVPDTSHSQTNNKIIVDLVLKYNNAKLHGTGDRATQETWE